MKTLKIDNLTHIRLTLFKNILNKKSFTKTLEKIMSDAAEYEFEYNDMTVEEYVLINGKK